MSKDLHPLRILRDSSRLSASLVVGAALMFAVNLALGRYLTAEEVGVIAVITAWTFYAGLVRPGFLAIAGRDVPHLIGAGETAEAHRVQNIALTGEILFCLIPLTILAVRSLFYSLPILRWGLFAAAIASMLVSVQTTFSSTFNIYHRFDLAAKQRFIIAIVTPVGILLTIRTIGVFSSLTMPAVASIIALVFFYRHRHVSEYRPEWDSRAALAMMRVGFPFTLMTLVSWAYFMSDRPALIAAGIPLGVLGYYSFASNIIRGAAQIFWDFTGVLQPILWHAIGREGSVAAVAADITKVWIPYSAAACAVTSMAQAGFGAVVYGIAPRFVPSIAIFEILVFILIFYNATQLPNLVLNSKAVNRQHTTLLVWTAGLALNVLTLYVCARRGATITTIAAVSMGVDAVIAIVAYGFIHRFLFASLKLAIPFYAWQFALGAVSVALYLVFQLTQFRYGVGEPWAVLAKRLLLAIFVWSLVAGIMRSWWVRLQTSSIGATPVTASERS